MRQDYQQHFNELNVLMSSFGAVCVEQSELNAEFSLPSGWLLKFECERYYGPSWDLKIQPPDRSASYSLWILMEVFQSLVDKDYGPATIENQIRFMAAESERLFTDVEFYADRYEKLNSP